jgi:hypothetical protein
MEKSSFKGIPIRDKSDLSSLRTRKIISERKLKKGSGVQGHASQISLGWQPLKPII